MMIGPAPMIRMLLISVRLGIFLLLHHRLAHEPYEAIEQVGNIGRPRRRLQKALKTERRLIGARKTLQRTFKQRHKKNTTKSQQQLRIDRKTMVLRRDQ